MIDMNRVLEVVLILVAALAATMSRFIHGIIVRKDYKPADPELAKLWDQRMRWAVAGEIAAVVLFVLIAEAIVIWKQLPGPLGVIMGAVAALLGFPFVSSLVRRRVSKHFEESS